MLTRVPEEIRLAEKALDFDELSAEEPLKFQFYYGENGQAEISNTIYLEDGNTPLKLYLEVFNDSEEVITLKNPNSVSGKLVTVQAGGSQAASEKKCHFKIRWEKDLGLKPSEIEMEASGEWQVNYDEEDRFFSIYFLHKSGLKLNKSDKIKLGFLKFTANNRTVKSSNVELLYGGNNLVVRGEYEEPIKDEKSSRIAVSVINYPGKTKIPLQFRVLGSNGILNDGTTQNTLKLKVINAPLSNNARPNLLLDSNSKFIVSFEKGSHADALVATDSQLNNVKIQVTDTNAWTLSHTSNSTEWSVTPKIKQLQLSAGQGIELSITNLVTSSASGFACIYIDYQNIGSYPDGRLVIPIEKTPLLYSGQNVGISTKPVGEWTNLSVAGNLVLGKNEKNTKFLFYSRKAEGGDFLQITNDKADGSWDWFQGIYLKRGGNVGIGTPTPKAKLHVSGGDAVISGNVGIGITNPTAKLHVDGGDAIISGNVGIGTTNPTAKLHVDGGDAIISGKVGIGTTNPAAKLHVNGGDAIISGKVGIGIQNPSAKLHVIEDLCVGRNEPNKKFVLRSPSDVDGQFLEITTDDGKGNWNWERGITLTRNNNVGIGTRTPAAKLDVNGSVKLGAGSTVWKQMICGRIYYDGSRWKYHVFANGVKIERSGARFKIYHGFTSLHGMDIAVLATVENEYGDNFACVLNIWNSYCEIVTRDAGSNREEPVGFCFMIIQFDLPPGWGNNHNHFVDME